MTDGDGTVDAEAASRSRADRVWEVGRVCWALVGILVVAVAVGYAVSRVPLVIVPVVLALFPATLLVPVAARLRRLGVPSGLASIGAIVLGLSLVGAVIGAMVPLVASQLPEVAGSASAGLGELQRSLADGPLDLDLGGNDGPLEVVQDQLGAAGDLAPQALSAATTAFEFVAGFLLIFVVVFFYLRDGRRLSSALIASLPREHRGRATAMADRAWGTLGRYFRGQLLVALVDAVGIGIGLLVLGVPLALPLSVLVFFGGLFPIVGAVVTGALAVLVALADQGITVGLIVLAIVLAVQQLESNVLEPTILGRVIELHPLVILLSITAGSVLLGVLGAFLAVPVAAVTAQVVGELRDDAATTAT